MKKVLGPSTTARAFRHLAKPTCRDDFQIAILTALDLETEAILQVFEEYCDSHGSPVPYGTHFQDQNSYRTGSIAGKPVVLCQLIGKGKLEACLSANHMRLSYPNLMVVLVVGVAGGNPSASLIPLVLMGDVAIGTRVIEMDFGKQYDRSFKRLKGVQHELSKSNRQIASFLTKLRPATKRTTLMQKIDHRTPTTSHPGRGKDFLCSSTFLHLHREPKCDQCADYSQHEETCEKAETATCRELDCIKFDNACDTQRDSSREFIANSTSIRQCHLHFGVVVSGSSVIKSGRWRDQICQSADNIIALEMEGAGVWEVLPTIVVKGICDYADSHKSKEWQKFAAARAASCAQILIEEWSLNESSQTGHSASVHSNEYWVPPACRTPRQTFRGYSEILGRLENRILDTRRQPQIRFVLSGMGGIGKTEVVLQLLQNPAVRKMFWGVFWVDCSTERSLQESFLRIATACHWICLSIQEVKDRLTTHSKLTLLILDNYDLVDTEQCDGNIPFADHVRVVVTGRSTELKQHASFDSKGNQDYQYISGLHSQSSEELIFILSEIDTLKSNVSAVNELASLLGHHPLAIQVACSFIRLQKWDVSEYTTWMRNPAQRSKEFAQDWRTTKQMKGFQDQSLIDAQYGRIYNTFESSAVFLESGGKGRSAVEALELLDFASCVDSAHISRDMFVQAWCFENAVIQRTADSMTLGLTKNHIELCREFSRWEPECKSVQESAEFRTEKQVRLETEQRELQSRKAARKMDTWESLLDPWYRSPGKRLGNLRKAMLMLCEVELATMNDNGKTISLHPVVHHWAKLRRDRRGNKNRALAISGSILALAVGDTVDWLPHNTHLLKHMEAYLSNDNWNIENDGYGSAKPITELFSQRNETGQWWQLIDRCRVHMTLAYPLVHMRSTKVTKDLQSLVNALGNLSGQAACGLHLLRARELFNASLEKDDPRKILQQEEIVQDLEARHGSSRHDRLVAQRNLADAYLEGGKTIEAILYLRHLEEQYNDKGLVYDNDMLAIQELLGVACYTGGEYALAVQILQRVVEKREQYEEEHEQSLCTAKRHLAQAYVKADRFDIAFQLLNHTRQIMLETRQAEDHHRLLHEYTLASAWYAYGDQSKAADILRDVVRIRKSTYGPRQAELVEAADLLKKIEDQMAKQVEPTDLDDSRSWSSMDVGWEETAGLDEGVSSPRFSIPSDVAGRKEETSAEDIEVSEDSESDEADGGVVIAP